MSLSWLGERVVVVSPHLDDAILSLGATIAHAARRQSRVEVLTVFAGDSQSEAPASAWDARAGFRTEGEAARRRREEDREACALVNAIPRWLPFSDQPYRRDLDREGVVQEVGAACEGADAVLFPGLPLVNDDHVTVTELLLRGHLAPARVGLYVEQPYAMQAARAGGSLELPERIRALLASTLQLERSNAGLRDLVAKWRAVGRYRSQLPLVRPLGRAERIVSFRFRLGLLRTREAVAWLPRA